MTGAAGGVGGYAVEPAKADGLTVVADAAPHGTDRVRGFGAGHGPPACPRPGTHTPCPTPRRPPPYQANAHTGLLAPLASGSPDSRVSSMYWRERSMPSRATCLIFSSEPLLMVSTNRP